MLARELNCSAKTGGALGFGGWGRPPLPLGYGPVAITTTAAASTDRW